MRVKYVSWILIPLFFLAFSLFTFFYQRYAISRVKRQISEHVAVVGPLLWNYDQSYTSYLTLAARTNSYANIEVYDARGYVSGQIEGSAPAWYEQWLITVKLMPLYTFREDIEYSGKMLGALIVTWRCKTIYTYAYVAICLMLAATGMWLFIRLKFSNNQLETQNTLLQHTQKKLQEQNVQLQRINSELASEIGERKQVEQKLQHAKEAALEAQRKAEAANNAKSTFLANMSHELRTPLNSVLGYAQILQRDASATEFQRTRLDVIERSGNHLLNLINDILDLSKIEARKMEIHRTAFRFQKFLEGVSAMIRIRAHRKGLLFHAEIAPDLPNVVCGDEMRLGQILLNLLGNAVKFTDQGRVTFRVEKHPSTPLKGGFKERELTDFPLDEDRGVYRFQVEDTGVGIPEDQLHDIFSPFKQVGDHTHTTEGTGLGLTISRKLIRMMDSDLHVSSDEGKGSTFTFDMELPREADISNSQAVGTTTPDQKNIIGYKGGTQKILVIDDKQDNRAVLAGLLQPLGFEIIEAADGREGLNKASEYEPDIVFMDLVMPVMNGFKCIRGIRNLPQRKHITIIVISASSPAESQELVSSAGCDDFISKPVQARELFSKLAAHLCLEWVYASGFESGAEESDGIGKQDEDFVIPPFADAKTLYKLGMCGNVVELCKELDRLEHTDERYVPFGRELRGLARTFQAAKIREFLEKYLGDQA